MKGDNFHDVEKTPALKARYQVNVIDSNPGTRDPFLGETNDSIGEEGANDHLYDGTDLRYDKVGPLRVVVYNLCVIVVQLDTLPSEYYAEEYPMRGQYGEDDKQCENVNDAAIRDNGVDVTVPESDAAVPESGAASQKDWPCFMICLN